MSDSQSLPTWTKFAIAALGGSSGWMFIHPADVVKVRLQINEGQRKNPFVTFINIGRTEGIVGLYSGLSAAITRQMTYTTMRLGLYDVIRDSITVPGEPVPLVKKLGCGLTAGGIAASLCCPVEVSLVRLQADGAAPPELRRNYKHVFDAMQRIASEEGASALYRGVGATVARGMVVSMTQLGTYDHAKTVVRRSGLVGDGIKLHFSASLISGFVYCVASLPLDIIKSRMQNQRPDPKTGELPYKSIPGAIVGIPAREGVFALWKGFIPYYARCGGHTITMFLFVEQYRKLFKSFLVKNEQEGEYLV